MGTKRAVEVQVGDVLLEGGQKLPVLEVRESVSGRVVRIEVAAPQPDGSATAIWTLAAYASVVVASRDPFADAVVLHSS